MKKFSIYVGLSDPETHTQLFTTEEYTNTLKNVCRSYCVPFSFQVINGGYIYDSGAYIEETTLLISLFDQPEKTVNEIAEDLCTFFNQERVLVTQSEAKMYYVKGDSEVKKTVQSLP